MVCLNNNVKLPNNAEWAYLYAIADIYENYSSSSYNKKDNNFPHPLTDTEITQILDADYNLKNVHRNTVANTRKKLEMYFDFEFGKNKKGRYLKQHSIGENYEDNMILLSYIVKSTPLLSKNKANQIISFMEKISASKDAKMAINKIKNEEFNNCENDYSNAIILILKAISNKQNIRFDYYSKQNLTVEPIVLKQSVKNTLNLIAYDSNASSVFKIGKQFDIRYIKNIKLLKSKAQKS